MSPHPEEATPAPDALEVLWTTCFDALALVDDERRFRRANPSASTILGTPEERIAGSCVDRFTPPELVAVLECRWDRLLRRGELRGPYEVLRADGTRTLVELRATREFAPGLHLVVAREVVPGVRPAASEVRQVDGVRLTPREREILQLAADGGTTRDIANVLVVSPGTVKTHFEHLYEKLGARDRASAVAEGLRRGLIA